MRGHLKTILLSLVVVSLTFLIVYRCGPKQLYNPKEPARIAATRPPDSDSYRERATAAKTQATTSNPSSFAFSKENENAAAVSQSSPYDVSPVIASNRHPRPSPPEIGAERKTGSTRNRTEMAANRVRTAGAAKKNSSRRLRSNEYAEEAGIFALSTSFPLAGRGGGGAGARRRRSSPVKPITDYEEAIKKYDQALAVNPAQPDVLVRKAQALNLRGLSILANEARQQANASGISSIARDDFEEARRLTERALELIPEPTVTVDPAGREKAVRLAALQTRAAATRLLVNFDLTQSEAGKRDYDEYLAAETDPIKKLRARRELAGMLLQTGRFELAKTEYEKILAESPNDVESLQNMSLTLHKSAELKKLQGDSAGSTAAERAAGVYLRRSMELTSRSERTVNDLERQTAKPKARRAVRRP